MIISQLVGGLGNQMFQYACGRAVSIRNGGVLKLDKIGLEKIPSGGTPRSYALGVFCIEESFASREEIKVMKSGKRGKLMSVLQGVGLMGRKNCLFVEPHFHFDSDILKVGANAYLQGYWQTEKYFLDIQDVIRKEFVLKEEFSIDRLNIAREIREENWAVSLHIRRGDYVTNPGANAFHGVCSLAYYAEAMRYVAGKIDRPVFYIFSDDIAWVKENLASEYRMVFVSNGILKDYEELAFMSLCGHHIIANSSFSWWGAWLNPNPEKIVVAPRRWFADESVNTGDLIPKQWIRL
jgi:hypothetical protein